MLTIKKLWKKIRRAIKYPILIAIIYCFIQIVRITPRRVNLWLYMYLGILVYYIAGAMRERVKRNLRFAYGDELTDKQVEQIAKGVFVNQAWHFSDYAYSINFTTQKQFARFIDFVDIDILKKEYDKGNGVICLFNHCGPWELSVLMPPILGFDTTAVSRSLPNPMLNRFMVHYRQKRGMKNINRNGKAYPQLISAINKGECLIIMIDQDTQVKSVYIDFFGKTAFTPIGAARMALDTKASVVPIQIKRQSNKRYTFKPLPPIATIRTDNYEDDILQNTINYTKAMEFIVRDAPEQWVWMHERWHTTPEIEQKWLEAHIAKKERIARARAEEEKRSEARRLRRQQRKKKLMFWR